MIIKDWKNLFDFLPNHLEKNNNQKISFLASLFSASLELCKEGMIEINQKRVFEKIFIKSDLLLDNYLLIIFIFLFALLNSPHALITNGSLTEIQIMSSMPKSKNLS